MLRPDWRELTRVYVDKQRQREQKLILTEEKLRISDEKLQKIWSLLPSLSDIPTLPQLLGMLSDLRKIREELHE